MTTREQLVQRGQRLEYLTLGWNICEAVIAVFAGVVSGSIALVGFGLDSVIECVSGGVLVWRLGHDRDIEKRERVERRALRLVGASFILLAAYVAIDATLSLWRREQPEESAVGIVLTAVSVIVMPLLARAKRQVAAGLNSGALHADSRQTDFCAYLSAITLGGLLLNAIAGLWWADPVAALVMTPIIAKEGLDGLRGKACECQLATDKACDSAKEESCGCHGANDPCRE